MLIKCLNIRFLLTAFITTDYMELHEDYMGGIKNTQSKICLFIDLLLAYMITDDRQIFIERNFNIYLFYFY